MKKFGSIEAGSFGIVEFRLLTEDKIESALQVQQRSMRQENVALGVGIYEEEGAAEAMNIIFHQVIKDDCTIIAVDKKTDQVVAVSFNKLHTEGSTNSLEEVVKNHVKAQSALALIDFLNDVESRVDMFEKYNTQAAMEIFYVGTDPKYRGFHIGQGVVAASLDLARQLRKYVGVDKILPDVAFGVFTSNYSQRIAEILKFEFLETVKYTEYLYGGKTMAERIGDSVHKTARLGALRL